ncbi:hypothetical protein [Streptodolium elevatio]|uniref:Secreted protein n=1 Tax=Streptodolium elevatio TaxID=3157996 RepID=A0ABV3DGM6_9ACTN
MTRDGSGDEAAIRALLGGADPAGAPEYDELLRDPIPPPPLDAAAAGPVRVRGAGRFSRRARWGLVGVVAVFAGAGGVAVGWDGRASRSENTDVIRCYSDTDVGGGDTFNGAVAGIGRGAKDSGEPSPVIETCSSMWRTGMLVPGGHLRETQAGADLPVPPLITCVAHGNVSALPAFNGETCASLKLRTWPTE